MARKPKALDKSNLTAGSDGNVVGAALKRAATRSPRKKPASDRQSSQSAKRQPEITDNAIRLRAYFISEERSRLSIPGDASGDWIEARRQLLAEFGEVTVT